MIFKLLVAGALVSSTFALGWGTPYPDPEPEPDPEPTAPFTIEIVDVHGNGCPEKEKISVELSPTGNYYITAQFNEYEDYFYAETNGEKTTSRVQCTIDYLLHLEESYKLDYAEFYIDGEYHLSESGTAFYSIRHNVPGVDQPVFHNISRSAFEQDPYSGNFQLFGSIEGIDHRVNYCGSSIPLQVQIRATARKSTVDLTETFVGVDNAEGDMGEREGQQKINCYGRVVGCN